MQLESLQNLEMMLYSDIEFLGQLNLLKKYLSKGLEHNFKKSVSRSAGYSDMKVQIGSANRFRFAALAHALQGNLDFFEIRCCGANRCQRCGIFLENTPEL